MSKLIGNRVFTFIAVICLCFVSVCANTAAWLSPQRKAAEDGLKSELNERAILADNYYKVAARYIDGDKALKELEAAISEAGGAKTAKKMLAASARIDSAVIAVSTRLEGENMGDDAKYRKSIPTDMDSINSRIRTDMYNRPAAAYNDLLKEPLKAFMKVIGFAKELPLAN